MVGLEGFGFRPRCLNYRQCVVCAKRFELGRMRRDSVSTRRWEMNSLFYGRGRMELFRCRNEGEHRRIAGTKTPALCCLIRADITHAVVGLQIAHKPGTE